MTDSNPNDSERDPNDPVKISFTVLFTENSEANEAWAFKRIEALREYDEGFYCRNFTTRKGQIFILETKAQNLQHEEFKKFMFQVKLKLGEDVKIR